MGYVCGGGGEGGYNVVQNNFTRLTKILPLGKPNSDNVFWGTKLSISVDLRVAGKLTHICGAL